MLHEIIKAEVTTAIEMARAFYPTKDIPMPFVKLSNRMTRASGKCSFRYSTETFTLTFSAPIIQQNNLDQFLARTVYHEVAHLVTQAVYGEMGHGSSFAFVMRKVLGRSNVQSTRCHSFKTTARNVRNARKEYKCSRCGDTITLGAIQHKRLVSGHSSYSHPRCGARIRSTDLVTD